MPSQKKSPSDDYINDFLRIRDHVIEGKEIKTEGQDFNVKVERKPLLVEKDGEIAELNISQSLIKRMCFKGEERPDVCPYNLYMTYLTNRVQTQPSNSMLYGSYAELKMLGKTSGDMVIDLPRNKKSGAKLADHERIDDAIERFKSIIVPKTGMMIQNNTVQIAAKKQVLDLDYDFPIYIKGLADIVSPFESKEHFLDYPAAVIDTKLTKDRESCYIDTQVPWQTFPWGCPEKMDHIQAVCYSWLFDLPFLYVVIDYNPTGIKAWWKPVPVNTVALNPNDTDAKARLQEFFQTVKWVVGKLWMMKEEGWKKEQSDACKKCPIHDCQFKQRAVAI